MKPFLVGLLALTLSTDARQFIFRDGTVIEAGIYGLGEFAPAADGLTLHMQGRIYFHHYPATSESYAPPTVNGSNPGSLPTCVPSRIAFLHFSRQTLLALRQDYERIAGPATAPAVSPGESPGYRDAAPSSWTPAAPPAAPIYSVEVQVAARNIITGIDQALEAHARFRPSASLAATQRWQLLVELEMQPHFGTQAIWGKQLRR